MTKNRQKLSWITLLLLCHCVSAENTSGETKEDLTQAEAKDGQLEIIKTIKKINEDGSYTIGYEADDGSFKIESRDVLGNVKGTYGYLNDDGEIKRVTYSTSNLTDILSETASVVQRIPKTNKTYSPTRKPSILVYNPTTPSTPTSTSVIQAIPRRRASTQNTSTTSTTTITPSTTQKSDRPSYGEYVKSSAEVLKSTTIRPPSIVYATSLPPRSLLYQQRPLLRSTTTPQAETQKSEGQIIRPEIVTVRPTDLPIFRRLAYKNALSDNEPSTIKPVTEEPQVRGNLLRRQLSQEKTTTFDPRQHVITLQQGLGNDAVDVYSASLTTGTPRPLFTTTIRPRILPVAPVIIEKSTPRYHFSAQDSATAKQETTTEYAQEATTTETPASEANTPSPVSAYQIPASQSESVQPQLVAVRNPFHGGVVLVPINQIRLQENIPNHPQYFVANNQHFRSVEPTQSPTSEQPRTPVPVFIPRPPILRSIPIQVDENGYVRPLPAQIVTPTPHPITIPVTPPPPLKYVSNEVQNEVDNIKPPVSTKDFQKLIELLIIRQRRLEQANALINSQQQRELLHPHRFRVIPRPTSLPILIRTPQEFNQNGPVTFIPETHISRPRQFITVPQMQLAQPQEQQTVIVRPQAEETRDVYVQEAPVSYSPAAASFTPTKRVARLLHSNPPNERDIIEEYLPPQIREMLLLRMLQLAINPSLPVEASENEEEDSVPSEQHVKKTGVRNVEVLGEEEDDDEKRPNRSKRFRATDTYYE